MPENKLIVEASDNRFGILTWQPSPEAAARLQGAENQQLIEKAEELLSYFGRVIATMCLSDDARCMKRIEDVKSTLFMYQSAFRRKGKR